MIILRGHTTADSPVTVEEIYDPDQAARNLARLERSRRNSAWLQAHWQDLLPRAYGKFVAVAGEEGFVADTSEGAWAWAHRAHPDDDTATVQYVRPPGGPQIYVNQRRMGGGCRWRVPAERGG
jgi:hypothetical protein